MASKRENSLLLTKAKKSASFITFEIVEMEDIFRVLGPYQGGETRLKCDKRISTDFEQVKRKNEKKVFLKPEATNELSCLRENFAAHLFPPKSNFDCVLLLRPNEKRCLLILGYFCSDYELYNFF